MTDKQYTTLDEHGFAVSDGWIVIYHANSVTGEYVGSGEEFLMTGTGIPANSYTDAPPISQSGTAIVRSLDHLTWEIVTDYRGQTAYDTQTRQPQVVSTLGELPSNLTLLIPETQYDEWDGNAWVTNTAAQRADAVSATLAVLATEYKNDMNDLNQAYLAAIVADGPQEATKQTIVRNRIADRKNKYVSDVAAAKQQ
ncbi:tail fiber assembly protein [Dickeya poaceiphila]|uniref:Tail fiber assembly protein n=1 Tax=Dickeya poaceiphila TaxID=568768 RepID=A0A5B8HJU5_9GAMM|nr:tail fiber assembly protein [Dickeya poaceiphila]QDX29576.1 tail fiber assembly protein [Dickeya poaceiphila]